MAFVKVQKNKAYYKRLQVKYRRRREGKTDYYARRKMVTQAKNKYNTPKYRLVVRVTNRKFICQIVYATIQGDRVLCQATSAELSKYGVPGGYGNYAAGYATGLLVARRALEIVGLDKSIVGVEEATAEEYDVADEDTERKPFKVILDVGMIRTIPGARIFGVLKGAVDGGLHIPHTPRRFPGYVDPEERGADYQYDASAHLERILGTHVVEFMEMLQEEDPEKYEQHFAKFVGESIEPDAVEDMYKECHKKIRENPTFEPEPKADITIKREGNRVIPSEGRPYNRYIKMTLAQRKDRVRQKMVSALQRMTQGDE